MMPSTNRLERFAAMMSDIEKNHSAASHTTMDSPVDKIGTSPSQKRSSDSSPDRHASTTAVASSKDTLQEDDWSKLEPIERFLRNIVVPQSNEREPLAADLAPSQPPKVINQKPARFSQSSTAMEPNRGHPNDHKPVHEVKVPPVKAVTQATYTLDPRMGEAGPRGSYASYDAVVKYCYTFAPPEYLQPLASAFFDAEKVWNREWDLYYVWSPLYPCNKAILFVTEEQLQALLDECNAAFPDANLTISDRERKQGLAQEFQFDDPDLRPRFLGHSSSKARAKFLEMEASESSTNVSTSTTSKQDIEAFRRKIELAREAAKLRNKGKKAASRAREDAQKRQMVNEHLRAQRYLGIIPKVDSASLPDASNITVSDFDITKPTPHPFDNDVIFISIDCEAWELNSSCITEVGVATLDARDLAGIAPGRVGENWFKKIRGRHFRIIEHKNRINKQYVAGCPDQFDFGKSEFVSEAKIASVLTSCFHEPFSRRDAKGELMPHAEDSVQPRNIVLVGHDLNQDIDYCHKLGFAVLNRGNLLDRVDSASLYRTYTRDTNPRALGSILCDFDLVCWHLHNAGNDAVCTLWALLAVAVSEAVERGTAKEDARHSANLVKRLEDAEETARERVYRGAEGWDMTGDGGVALSPEEKALADKGDKGSTWNGKPVFGPERPPEGSEGQGGLWTMGGVPLDI